MLVKPDKKVPTHSMLGADLDTALAGFCPDLEQWPKRWHYDEPDIAPGEQIVAYIKPFLLHLLSENLSPKTRRRHRDNVWLLGGELIRLRYEDSKLRNMAIPLALSALLSEEGGPMVYPRICEAQQNAFDATCRKLYRFIDSNQKPVRQE
jgi:hypothetical protein